MIFKKIYLSVFIFIIITCGFALSSYAQDKLLDIQTIESASGIKAWLVEDHSVPVISLQFSFKGSGAINDPEGKDGLARLASNTMDEGAGELDSNAFQKKLQDLAITLLFNSDRDNFGGTLKTTTKNKDEAFGLLKMALTQPRFDEEPVERMRKANQSRIRDSLSDPEWLAMRIMNDKAYEGHAYARNSGGTLSTLENITTDDLRNFHAGLKKDDLSIAVAGDISAKELEAILNEIFAELPSRAESLLQDYEISLKNTGQTFFHDEEIPQTIILMMQKGIDLKSPDYHTGQVMNFILGSSGFGSRLTDEIREKRGLTYGIYSYFTDMAHVDTLSVQTSVKNQSATETLKLIKAEWSKMKNTQVSDKELDDAKAYLIGSLPLSLTSTDKIAGLMLSLQLDGLPADYLDQRKMAIENVTPEHIQDLARNLLNTDNLITVLVGQPENIDELNPRPITIKDVNGVE